MDSQPQNKIRSFKDIQAWQKAHRLYLDALNDIKAIPRGEPGGRELASQILRCVGSMSANIAEGFASDGPVEYCRFLTIARKSAAEAENWYLKLIDAGFLAEGGKRAETCEEISKMLYSLRRKVRESAEANPVPVHGSNNRPLWWDGTPYGLKETVA